MRLSAAVLPYSEAGDTAKPSREERRRAEKMKKLEEDRRKKDEVKDRMDLIRQMKGDQRWYMLCLTVYCLRHRYSGYLFALCCRV